MWAWVGFQGGGGGFRPRLSDDYVVEGRVALAKASEPDLDDHHWALRIRSACAFGNAGEKGRADLLGACKSLHPCYLALEPLLLLG